MATKNSNNHGDTRTFEADMEELEKIVSRLEDEGASLDECLSAFEQGIALTRRAQRNLSTAEQKVKLLLEKDGEPSSEDFSRSESDE